MPCDALTHASSLYLHERTTLFSKRGKDPQVVPRTANRNIYKNRKWKWCPELEPEPGSFKTWGRKVRHCKREEVNVLSSRLQLKVRHRHIRQSFFLHHCSFFSYFITRFSRHKSHSSYIPNMYFCNTLLVWFITKYQFHFSLLQKLQFHLLQNISLINKIFLYEINI